MKLKRVAFSLYYHETSISEYALLTEYNPIFINTKIKAINTHIEAMYHLNMSHITTNEVMGIISISYPVEKLVIKIIEEKEKLQRYKKKSSKNMKQLKQILKGYSPSEQKEVMCYMRSNGATLNYELIERLQRDLYEATRNQKVLMNT